MFLSFSNQLSLKTMSGFTLVILFICIFPFTPASGLSNLTLPGLSLSSQKGNDTQCQEFCSQSSATLNNCTIFQLKDPQCGCTVSQEQNIASCYECSLGLQPGETSTRALQNLMLPYIENCALAGVTLPNITFTNSSSASTSTQVSQLEPNTATMSTRTSVGSGSTVGSTGSESASSSGHPTTSSSVSGTPSASATKNSATRTNNNHFGLWIVGYSVFLALLGLAL